jgi:hypothetical protein
MAMPPKKFQALLFRGSGTKEDLRSKGSLEVVKKPNRCACCSAFQSSFARVCVFVKAFCLYFILDT